MKKESQSSKSLLRRQFQALRKNLSVSERKKGEQKAYLCLKELLAPFKKVLSFYPLPEEIDLFPINQLLARENRLCLPRVEGTTLTAYAVKDLTLDLSASSLKVFEPLPHLPSISPKQIECALIPGLVFDRHYHRLGYGKGYYDRFLQKLTCPLWGIGFSSQYLAETLPIEKHDFPLDKLYLF